MMMIMLFVTTLEEMASLECQYNLQDCGMSGQYVGWRWYQDDEAEVVVYFKLEEVLQYTKPTIRTLAGRDLAGVTALDDQSGFNYTQWVEELGPDEETMGCYGAFIDDRLVGYCTVSDADDDVEIEKHPSWTVDAQMLNYVFVEAESRGRGVGSVLINEALKEAGPVSIYTKISRSELAVFYQKAGFELIDRKQSVMVRLNKSEQSNQKLWAISKKINDLNMGAITMLAPDEVCESVMVYNALVRNGYADTQRTSVADMFVRYGFKSEIVNNFWHISL